MRDTRDVRDVTDVLRDCHVSTSCPRRGVCWLVDLGLLCLKAM